jgi:hypothetical protein
MAAAHGNCDCSAVLVSTGSGDPFQPKKLSPQALSTEVAALAEKMYASRNFDAMPMLAKALEAAGCRDVTILNHCKRPGEHVRGCWVIDLILGKQ